MAYAGLDTYGCPSDEITAWWLANTNLRWLGYYLGGPSSRDTSWLSKRAAKVAQGWGLMPVFEGQQVSGPGSKIVTAAQGVIDGADAVRLMQSEGFASCSKVALDLETPDTWEVWGPYVTSFFYAVAKGSYTPAVYFGHGMGAGLVEGLAAAGIPNPPLWPFRVTQAVAGPMAAPYSEDDPAALSGVPGASICQCARGATISDGQGGTVLVDLNTATTPDPCAP